MWRWRPLRLSEVVKQPWVTAPEYAGLGAGFLYIYSSGFVFKQICHTNKIWWKLSHFGSAALKNCLFRKGWLKTRCVCILVGGGLIYSWGPSSSWKEECSVYTPLTYWPSPTGTGRQRRGSPWVLRMERNLYILPLQASVRREVLPRLLETKTNCRLFHWALWTSICRALYVAYWSRISYQS